MEFIQRRNIDRIGNILVYLAGNTVNCGVTKTNKLLYYIDCYHLLKYNRTVLGTRYSKWKEGPVPVEIYSSLKNIMEAKGICVDDFIPNDTDNFESYLSQYIDIEIQTLPDGKNLYKLIPKKEFNPKVFSQSERDAMSDVCNEFKYTSATELSNRTHKEQPWLLASSEGDIDLALYLTGKVSDEQIEFTRHFDNDMKSINHCQ